MTFLPAKGIRRHTCHSQSLDADQSAGVFLDLFLVDAGGDVELVEIFSAEGAGGCFQAGELDPVQLFTCRGIVADHTGTVAECNPEVAVAIDGHAIG